MKSIEHYGQHCSHPIMENAEALRVSGLYFSYLGADTLALEDISFSVKPGEKVALVGPNGAGKSTLLKLILGLEQASEGTMTIYGSEAHQCKHRVSIVPQKSSVNWNFPVTVEDVVMMGRYVHLGWFKYPKKKDKEKVEEALKTMEILDLRNTKIGELSGGQQQRVMLARTLAHDADLLLMDEPLNHLDLATQELIFHTVEDLCSRGKSIIISTHDLGVLTVHFSRVVFIDKKLIADGPIDEVLTPEAIAQSYGFEFHKSKVIPPWLLK